MTETKIGDFFTGEYQGKVLVWEAIYYNTKNELIVATYTPAMQGEDLTVKVKDVRHIQNLTQQEAWEAVREIANGK